MILQPIHELQIIGDAAQKGHGDVSVGVDQTGEDDPSIGVEAMSVGVGLEQLLFGTKSCDRVPDDKDCAILDDGVVLVEGDKGAVVDDQVLEPLRAERSARIG